MKRLLALARGIDAITDCFAVLAKWAILAACAISTTNAVIRYSFDISSNAFLEVQWYLFAACVMFGAAQVLRVNEHVRVDIFYGMYPTRAKVLVDLAGLVLFLLPMTLFIAYSSLPVFVRMFVSQEMSSNSGGLIRWPAMLTIPLGLSLVALQGVSEIIKRAGWLMHVHEMDTHYERPLQ
ncbi:TRAP transporter small permease subunit [Hydrogenophaga sp.]|jgi:TRAP-type mannitol/chloroaromatic compound transport system permease small subunit|uniref:TRAP transporter small permease subunit n=1 Tax=Hydrogenophaga sp. TaxID=1904254 RepID=UPI003F71F415